VTLPQCSFTHFIFRPLDHFVLSGYKCHSAQNTYLSVTLLSNCNTNQYTLSPPRLCPSSCLQTSHKTQGRLRVVTSIETARVIDLPCFVLGFCSATTYRRQTTESYGARVIPLPLQASNAHTFTHPNTNTGLQSLKVLYCPSNTRSHPVSMRDTRACPQRYRSLLCHFMTASEEVFHPSTLTSFHSSINPSLERATSIIQIGHIAGSEIVAVFKSHATNTRIGGEGKKLHAFLDEGGARFLRNVGSYKSNAA
jgi:hypothetical protein